MFSGAKIESATMKENVTLEAVAVPIAVGLLDQLLDPAVDAFGGSVAQKRNILDTTYLLGNPQHRLHVT